MKIYTNPKTYNNALKYWSNACGELHYHGERDITEDELPDALKDAYNRLWEEGTGSYVYLAEYNGEYGIAIINEYHELNDKGEPGEPNNYKRAVEVGKKFQDIFPEYKVFIGKEMGFPGVTSNGTQDDFATELVVFATPDKMSKADFNKVMEWLCKNAYV